MSTRHGTARSLNKAPEVYGAVDDAGTIRGEIHHRTDIPQRTDLGELPNYGSSRSRYQCRVSHTVAGPSG